MVRDVLGSEKSRDDHKETLYLQEQPHLAAEQHRTLKFCFFTQLKSLYDFLHVPDAINMHLLNSFCQHSFSIAS